MGGRGATRVRGRALIVLVALLNTALAGCQAEAADPAEGTGDPALPTTSWRTLGSWEGRGDRQTGSFDVTTGALRLAWEARDGGSDGHLSVSLHSAISGRPLETMVVSHGPGSDTVHVALQPRVAYLRIESEGVDWTLTLAEGVTRTSQGEQQR